MTKPLFTDNQFVNAALLNGAMDQTFAEFRRFPRLTWNPGLIAPEAITLGVTGLSVGVGIPAGAGVLFGTGIFAEMHGTVSGADTQSAVVSFSGVVPGSGSVTAYLVASYAEIQQGAYTLVGPPIGHPDYNPNFSPVTAYSGAVASLAIGVQTGAPDNSTIFELARCTLAAGATGVVLSTANQLRSAVSRNRVPTLVTGSAAITAAQMSLAYFVTGGLPLTTTLPAAAAARGETVSFANHALSNFWTLAAASSGDVIVGSPYTGSGVAGVSGMILPPGRSVELMSTGTEWLIVAGNAGPRIYGNAGNPNGSVLGFPASGAIPPDMCFDYTNNAFYVTTGASGISNWLQMPNALSVALQSTNYVVAGGTSAAWSVTGAVIGSLAAPGSNAACTGMRLCIYNNTGVANITGLTINYNGYGALPVVWPDGTVIYFSQVVNGGLLEVLHQGTQYTILNRPRAQRSNFGTTGYQIFDNNIICQWGRLSINPGPVQSVAFPIAFPNACFSVTVCEGNAQGGNWGAGAPTVHGVSDMFPSQYNGWALAWTGGGWTGGNIAQNFIAMGY